MKNLLDRAAGSARINSEPGETGDDITGGFAGHRFQLTQRGGAGGGNAGIGIGDAGVGRLGGLCQTRLGGGGGLGLGLGNQRLSLGPLLCGLGGPCLFGFVGGPARAFGGGSRTPGEESGVFSRPSLVPWTPISISTLS